MNTKWNSLIYRMRTDKRGIVAIIVGLGLPVMAAMLGLVAQEPILYRTQSALQSSANIAALAGAQDINCSSPCSPATAKTTATSYSAVTGGSNAISGQTVTMASGYPQLKCLTSTGVSCTGPDNANAIVVKQQATVPLIFGQLLSFGASTLTLTATATAGGSGGFGTPLDIMLIVDTTGSMNTSDPNCSISGSSRVMCAMAGARTLLLGKPSASPPNYGLPPSTVQVGLMLFPGLTNSSQPAYDYDCASSPKPAIAKYSASPVYQIIGLSSDYKTSDTASSLNPSSNLMRALHGGSAGCTQGLEAIGGVHTFYADIMAAAETALTTNGRSGVQKVIILLSDGDANANASDVPAGKSTNQCHQAIITAAAATAAGTWVYIAAYGAVTSATPGSCWTDSPAISACSTLQQMASTPKLFFSDGQGGCTSPNNASSELVGLFTNIGASLSPPRLLLNTTN